MGFDELWRAEGYPRSHDAASGPVKGTVPNPGFIVGGKRLDAIRLDSSVVPPANFGRVKAEPSSQKACTSGSLVHARGLAGEEVCVIQVLCTACRARRAC